MNPAGCGCPCKRQQLVGFYFYVSMFLAPPLVEVLAQLDFNLTNKKQVSSPGGFALPPKVCFRAMATRSLLWKE
jgi:hypothetical protein